MNPEHNRPDATKYEKYEFHEEPSSRPRGANSSNSCNSYVRADRPRLHGDALIGPTRWLVEAWRGHTEADPAALAVSFLVCCGVVFGRGPRLNVGAGDMTTNLYGIVVGPTSTGRKGESLRAVERVMRLAVPSWDELTLRGVGSGEALIEAVRDPRVETADDGSESTIDPGVTDKRRLILAAEFARILNVGRREGSTLADLIREAWDGPPLQLLTRSRPLRATDHHVGLLGHITPQELAERTSAIDVAGGLLNRCLFAWSQREALIPFPAPPDDDALRRVAYAVTNAVEFAQHDGRLRLDQHAEKAWEIAYPVLSADRPGRIGSLVARAPALALRVAVVYALLDHRRVIGVEHLKAALAVVQYSESTAMKVFPARLSGDAERILDGLRAAAPDGLTRTGIHDLLGRNRRSSQIDEALRELHDHGLARQTEAGRWVAT